MNWLGQIVKRLFAGCLLAFVTIIVAAAPVAAQQVPPPSIGILDVQRLLRDSSAAQSIRTQIERLRKGYQKDVRDRENVLRKAEQELIGQRAILAPEAFAKRRREFETRARTAQQEVRTRKRAIDRSLVVAMNKIRRAFLKIAQNVASENKIIIVMAKSAVLMSMKNLEITAETMKRLNKQLPKVAVEIPKKK
jgi:Skp family chaperone for outer membrane proteins